MLLKRLFKNKFIITFLVSIFLVVGVSPVYSQIPTSNVKSSNLRLLVQQGEELYRQQKLSTALKYFKKAADIFEQQEDKFNQAITLTNLGKERSVLHPNEICYIKISRKINIKKT